MILAYPMLSIFKHVTDEINREGMNSKTAHRKAKGSMQPKVGNSCFDKFYINVKGNHWFQILLLQNHSIILFCIY
ncbi:Os02g0735150 [Oryza sativa Japonica Group]|uniref:Os02g0735150 protein n=1 Tax=Oryza sativa subsp. japonica TaxID=39947 RepID=A0A0P0VPB1_ORYSJ|nr:hypothetical protein EE612_013520 [Oryza sativa]BAS80795.1 Os02g0735150 [Oryza sativa Japonica Group]